MPGWRGRSSGWNATGARFRSTPAPHPSQPPHDKRRWLMQATERSLPDLLTPWVRYKASLYKQHPVTANRASQLGGDCDRELVYLRTRWQDAAPPPLDLQILFQEG